MKAFLAIATAALLSGCAQTSKDPLCAVISDPSSYVGKRLTLNGTARIYKQKVGLYSHACPSQALILTMSPEDAFKLAHQESTANTIFLSQVTRLLGTGASVTVTGHVNPAYDLPDPFVLTVESGALK